MKNSRTKVSKVTASEIRIRNTIKKAVNATSVTRVAKALELAEETILRLAGGMRVQTGTLLVAENNLANLSREGAR